MPYTFQMYLDLLLKQLTGGSSEPVVLTDEQVRQAVEKVKRQIKELGPNPQDLDGSFNSFCENHANTKVFRGLRPASDTFGQTGMSRYEYSERCRNEVMKNVEHHARQTLEWRSAVKRLGITNEDGTIKAVNTGRWLGQLIKVDGTEESLRYNETIVALAALGNGVITKDEYLALRTEYHTTYGKKSPEDAAKTAQSEYDNRAEFLLSEVEKAVESDHERLNHYKDAAIAIQSGDFSKFEGSMERAFETFFGNTELLAMSGVTMFEDLQGKFGLKRTPEEQREITLRWQEYTTPANGFAEAAEQVANPYFAVFDPYKYYRAISTTKSYLPTEKVSQRDELAFFFMRDGVAYLNTANRALNNTLRQYGLDYGDEIFADRTGDFNVYMKDDRAVILKIGPMSEDALATCDESVPEQMVTEGTQATVDALLARCGGWSKKFRTSKRFENMRTSLEALEHLGFEDNNDIAAKIKAAGAGLEELRADAQAYIEGKRAERPDENWNGSYETARVNFALDVLEFTETKLRQISYYSMFAQTRNMRAKVELEAEENPAWRNDPRYAGMTPMEHKLALEREDRAAAAEKERLRQEAARQEERRAEQAFRLADGDRSLTAYDRLFDGLGDDAGNAADALTAAERFAEGYKNSYNSHVHELENERIYAGEDNLWTKEMHGIDMTMFDEAKYLIAGYVIAEMLNAEQAALEKHQRDGAEGEVKTPIRQLVNAGKTMELADLIIKSAHFKQRFSERLSNPEDVKKLIEERDVRDRATRRDCYRAGKDFLDNIDLARQHRAGQAQQNQGEKAPEANEVPQAPAGDVKNGPKKEAAPAQNVINEDEPENNNRINFVNEPENPNRINIIDDEEEEINPRNKEEKPAEEKKAVDREAQFKTELAGYLVKVRDVPVGTAPALVEVDRRIADHMRTYRRMSGMQFHPALQKASVDMAKTALAGATLKYMINREAPAVVLANTVERGRAFDLIMLIQNSPAFEKNFKDITPERVNAMLEDEELFCRPVGDALLNIARETLENESLRVNLQRGKERRQELEGGSKFTPEEREEMSKLATNFERITELANYYDKCNWVDEYDKGLPYGESPSKQYLTGEIDREKGKYETFMSIGSRMLGRQNLKRALSEAILVHMIDNDPTGMVLENAVQKDQLLQLVDMVSESSVFKKQYEELDNNNIEKMNVLFEDGDLFVRPVGDKLISMMKPALEYAGTKLAEVKKSELLGKLKRDIAETLEKSGKAHDSGNHAEAEKYGVDALALQSTYILLTSMNEKGKLPRCTVTTMAHRVRDSKQFKEAVSKFNLKEPGELNKAISQRVSSGIVKSIVEEQKQMEKAESDRVTGKWRVTTGEAEKQQKQQKQGQNMAK